MPVHARPPSDGEGPRGGRREPLDRYAGVNAREKEEAAATVAGPQGLGDNEAAAAVVARPPRLEGGRPFIPTGLAASTMNRHGVDGPAKVVAHPVSGGRG